MMPPRYYLPTILALAISAVRGDDAPPPPPPRPPLPPLGDVDVASDVSSSDASSSSSIPRTIIQTAPRDDSLRDPDWIDHQSALLRNNPNFAHLQFDDESSLRFVDEHYGGTDLPRLYRDAPRAVLRADLFRLAAVKVLGGFYMDMDMVGKASFEPLIESSSLAPVEGGGEGGEVGDGEGGGGEGGGGGEVRRYRGAVFPREWWRSDSAYRQIYGRPCPDADEHWQVGNYAFAAVPNHPLVEDALAEAMRRCARLMEEKSPDDITDADVLLSTGPYMLSELYHAGRRSGKYSDVLHLPGDDVPPLRRRSYGGNDWHKFGPYAEHMLSHSWVQRRRRMRDGYGGEGDCLARCLGDDLYELYDFMSDAYGLGDLYDLYGVSDLYGLFDLYGLGPENEYGGGGGDMDGDMDEFLSSFLSALMDAYWDGDAFLVCLDDCLSPPEVVEMETSQPTSYPVADTAPPTSEPTSAPTSEPTVAPTVEPATDDPTSDPTVSPTEAPVYDFTEALPKPLEDNNAASKGGGTESVMALMVSIVIPLVAM